VQARGLPETPNTHAPPRHPPRPVCWIRAGRTAARHHGPGSGQQQCAPAQPRGVAQALRAPTTRRAGCRCAWCWRRALDPCLVLVLNSVGGSIRAIASAIRAVASAPSPLAARTQQWTRCSRASGELRHARTRAHVHARARPPPVVGCLLARASGSWKAVLGRQQLSLVLNAGCSPPGDRPQEGMTRSGCGAPGGWWQRRQHSLALSASPKPPAHTSKSVIHIAGSAQTGARLAGAGKQGRRGGAPG